MILMLTKHHSYSFLCLTSYICVFCRNEENEMKNEQFEKEMKKLCNEEVVIETIAVYGLWSQPQIKNEEDCKTEMQCGRDHKRLFSTNLRYGRDHRALLQQTVNNALGVVSTTPCFPV